MPARRLEAHGEVAPCRERLALERARLRAEYDESRDAGRYLRGHRSAVDVALRELWRGAALPRALALVAVGGYGRGELYPRSDVDVLILLPGPLAAAEEQAIERFVGHLWDVGIELGHSVRTVAQCVEEAAKDITVQTALLEARLLGGSRASFNEFRKVLRTGFDPQAFFKAKRLEQEQRHAKYQDSPYSLEPNLKEAPGGLRDLQVILWVSRASGLGADWRDLAARGLVTRRGGPPARVGTRSFSRRLAHPPASARRSPRGPHPVRLPEGARRGLRLFDATAAKRASEHVHAAVLPHRESGHAAEHHPAPEPRRRNLSGCGGRRRCRSTSAFRWCGELLDARDPHVFEREPRAILESFLLLQQHPELKGMTAPHAARALARAHAASTPRSGAIRRTARCSSACCSSRAASSTSCAG